MLVQELAGSISRQIERILALETVTPIVDEWNRNPVPSRIRLERLPIVTDDCPTDVDPALHARLVHRRNNSVLMFVGTLSVVIDVDTAKRIEDILSAKTG